MNIDRERQELLELFYQCPVGLLEIDDRGLVRKVNPAAARMLAPVLGSRDLGDTFSTPMVCMSAAANPPTLGRVCAISRRRPITCRLRRSPIS